MLIKEIWKIIRYAPNYHISNLGNIKNKKNKLLLINYERLKKINTRAHPGLYVNGKQCQYFLHRIVAEHFIENPQKLPEVNHIDGNFHNNVQSNLEWISKLDNMRHADENNLIKRYMTKIKVTNKQTNEIIVYESIKKCSENINISYSNAARYIKKGENKMYKFEYEDSQRRVINETGVIWKEFPECDKYMVSNTGEVKHKKNKNILKACMVNGYKFLTLYPKLNRLVHRMVAMTFLENPNNLPIVDHKDGNELNNHVDNLRWCTQKENMNNPITIKKMSKNYLNNK